jgi:hypothetical protein
MLAKINILISKHVDISPYLLVQHQTIIIAKNPSFVQEVGKTLHLNVVMGMLHIITL